MKRHCGEPTGKTVECNRAATEMSPGIWQCPIGHIRKDGREPDVVPVTVAFHPGRDGRHARQR